MEDELPQTTYSWTLDTTKSVILHDTDFDYYKSPYFRAFGYNWQLKLHVKRKKSEESPNIFVYVNGMTAGVSELNVEYVLNVGAKRYESTQIFDKGKYNNWAMPWKTLSQSDVSNKKVIHCSVELTLLNVYDTNGKDITASYLAKHAKQKQQPPEEQKDDTQQSLVSVRVDSLASQLEKLTKDMKSIKLILKDIQLQINEEQKENSKRFSEIEKNVKSLQLNGAGKEDDGSMDKEKLQFKNWVYNTLKLGEYYDLFVEQGVETLDVMKAFTMDELKEMGISKMGHRKKIFQAIAALQQNDNQQIQEGGTAIL